MNLTAWLRGRVLLAAVIVAAAVLAVQAGQQRARTANLRTFTNQAGWSVRYPPNWRFQSCKQCDNPTEPNALLLLSSPSGHQTITIERLADKPEGKAADTWLHEVAEGTALTPIRREEWIALDGSKALKVVNEGSENIYAVRGSLTVAIRYSRPAHTVLQILSSFRFEHPK
jgi:hypothetical protein